MHIKCILFLVFLISTANLQGQTTILEDIDQKTVLTPDNSPYTLINLGINAELVIEKGVKVNLHGAINVNENGSILAIGATISPTSNSISAKINVNHANAFLDLN